MDKLRNYIAWTTPILDVNDYAHLGISPDTCFYSLSIITFISVFYIFLWQIHFFLVVKNYHERGKLAMRRKQIASYQAASNFLHSAGLSNRHVDLPADLIGQINNPRLGINSIEDSLVSDSNESGDARVIMQDQRLNDESRDSIEISAGQTTHHPNEQNDQSNRNLIPNLNRFDSHTRVVISARDGPDQSAIATLGNNGTEADTGFLPRIHSNRHTFGIPNNDSSTPKKKAYQRFSSLLTAYKVKNISNNDDTGNSLTQASPNVPSFKGNQNTIVPAEQSIPSEDQPNRDVSQSRFSILNPPQVESVLGMQSISNLLNGASRHSLQPRET